MSWKGLIKISFMKEDFLNSYFIKAWAEYCKQNAQNEETSQKRRKIADILYLCSSSNKNLNNRKGKHGKK